MSQKEAKEIFETIEKQLHHSNGWEERIKRRSNAFFLIIKGWVEYVERSIRVSNEIEWNDIPGYREIVNALISEL